MPKHYSGREVVKRLSCLGFVVVSQKGSHLKMRGLQNGKLRTAIIPMHKQIASGTLVSVLFQAGISKEDLDGAK